jgi:hypothetical protein
MFFNEWILSGFMAAVFSVITKTKGKMRVNIYLRKVKCRSRLVHQDANECSGMCSFYHV